ncbi:MAG TPA: hypothetical protein VFO28_07635, partial [Burkholderiaceae bacterium]|nr:hypothetical protein [Burkholderiaceae bacterium]
LCAACLALGDCPQARAVAQSAWPQSVVFDVQHAAASYLALLAALEGRPRAAAQLLGFTTALYAARDETPEANELAALQRAQALAAAALGDGALQRARTEGAQLHEREIAALAFGQADV